MRTEPELALFAKTVNYYLRQDMPYFPLLDVTRSTEHESCGTIISGKFTDKFSTVQPFPSARFLDMSKVLHAVSRKEHVRRYYEWHLKQPKYFDTPDRMHTSLRHSIINVYRRRMVNVLDSQLSDITNQHLANFARLNMQYIRSEVEAIISESIIMPLNLYMLYYGQVHIDFNIPYWRLSLKGIRRWAMCEPEHHFVGRQWTDTDTAYFQFLHPVFCEICSSSKGICSLFR